MENTKTPRESDGNWSMRKWPFPWLWVCARFVTGGRFCFLVGRHEGHHKKSLSNDSSVTGYSALIPAWGKRRARGQEDAGVEGNVGRGIWKEMLQDRHPPRGGKEAACPLPAQRGGRSWCSHSPLLLCSPARMKRWRFVLMVLMISTPSGLFTMTAFHISLLTQRKTNLAFRAVVTNGAPLVSTVGWFTGGWHGRLSLQSRMRCLHLPLLPRE